MLTPTFPHPWLEGAEVSVGGTESGVCTFWAECGAGGGAECASAVERQSPSDQQETSNLSIPRPECGNVHVTINQASSVVDLILSSVAP